MSLFYHLIVRQIKVVKIFDLDLQALGVPLLRFIEGDIYILVAQNFCKSELHWYSVHCRSAQFLYWKGLNLKQILNFITSGSFSEVHAIQKCIKLRTCTDTQ